MPLRKALSSASTSSGQVISLSTAAAEIFSIFYQTFMMPHIVSCNARAFVFLQHSG
jgi:hypothetical protein